MEALISWLSSWGFGAYCQIEQPGVCISIFHKTSNRVSHFHCCLVPVSVGFHPVFSDPEGCIAGGLGHSAADSKTGCRNQAFSSSSSETHGKDELRACGHRKCSCWRGPSIPTAIKYWGDRSTRTEPGMHVSTPYTNLPFPGYEVLWSEFSLHC